MPLSDRNYMKGKHPPACTCVDCVNKRLKKLGIKPPKQTKYSRSESPHQRQQAEYYRTKRTREKHIYPRHVNIIANIVLVLIVIFIIGIIGGGIFAISKYHNNAWEWVTQKYGSVANSVVNFKDKTINSFSNTNTNSQSTTTNVITSPTVQTSKTPDIIDKVSSAVKTFVLWDTDTNNYAVIFNQYRQTSGKLPLIFTDDLNKIATLRLDEIRMSYNHQSIGGYNKYLAENIVKGSNSNQESLTAWENSPGHNANMLDSDYKYTGYAAGGGYAVQVFTEWNTINGIPQLPPGWYFPN
jgi:uncharacterized protein YkwD